MVKNINKMLGRFGIQLKNVTALENEKKHFHNIINGGIEIFYAHKKFEKKELNQQISGLVFSKDRAMQLHALLTSYFAKVTNYFPLTILYKTTNRQSQLAYDILKALFASYSVVFLEENYFNGQVKFWLSTQSADRIFFMTDDAIVLDDFDMNDVLHFDPLNEIFSLTKGKDLTYCFTMDVNQELPLFGKYTTNNDKIFNEWNWQDALNSPDWSYPLSLDGTFFLREEMLTLINSISFNNPNSLEANLQLYIAFFLRRKGICYDKVKIANIPCNLVQDDFKNRSTGFFTAEQLQLLWDDGKRIDVQKFYGLDAFDAEHKKYDFCSVTGGVK